MQTKSSALLSQPSLSRLFLLGCIAVMTVSIAPPMMAQDQGQSGIESGNYNVKQSVEFGYRFTNITGSIPTYDTFLNLQQGPRLMDFTTEMTSLNHHGSLFDRLYLSNFGYGGDPNSVSRFRMSKDKWYNFNALFRRDKNIWNYSLQANPLNPSTAFANAPAGFTPIIGFSPHAFDTVRRLGDYDLTVMPQSRMRLRLGYSRNIAEGPTFSTYHQGTEALLLQNWKTTLNAYRIGVDFKFLPRTNISYDEFLSYYKGDTGQTDNNLLFALSNGRPVDIGISLNAGANQPCGSTFAAGTHAVNSTCNAYLAYSQFGRVRTSSPTEQFSFQSNYFKKVDLSGRFSYAGGDTNVNSYSWNFFGRDSRAGLRNGSLFGPVSGKRVAATADYGGTLHITGNLDLIDSFHFSNFHNPVLFDGSSCSFFSPDLLTNATIFMPTASVPVVCPSPAGGTPGTPAHSTSSGPDVALAASGLLLKQDEKTNLTELEYRMNSKIGGRLGYRYRHRTIADTDFESGIFVFFPTNANTRTAPRPFNTLTCPAANNRPDGSCLLMPAPLVSGSDIDIQEHSGLFGIWARPTSNWRMSFDAELMSADNAFTRISPRQTQEYRVRSTYKPVNWASVSGSIYIWEGRNNVVQINNLQHNRMYGFSAALDPNSRFGLELGYDYNDVFSQILICYTSSTAPKGLAQCPNVSGLVQQLSTYTNTSHYVYFNLNVEPVKRLTARLGSNVTVTNGTALLLSPNAVPGPLNSHYYEPFGGIDYAFTKNWTGKAYWGFYGYNEDKTAAAQDIFNLRNFRGNIVTLSARYAF